MTIEIVDLTGPLEPSIWLYDPTFPAFSSEPVTRHAEQGFVVQRVTISTHMGTHTDSLSHLAPNEPTLDAVPLSRFVGEAQVLNVTAGPLAAIDAARLQQASGELRRGDIALIRTGWDAHWYEPDYATSHPFLTLDAAKWLIEVGVKCVGMDTAGLMDARIDLAPSRRVDDEVVDEVLLRAGVSYVAGLINLGSVSESRVWFAALPMKLAGLDGAPVRAIAILGQRRVGAGIGGHSEEGTP
ncbi:MAG TPA: cyclase family protein [Candidatus Sulfotelmatobacter sp.]|nr:cyclase family protein [Candidatus Sulfotelmatobacter sp.]